MLRFSVRPWLRLVVLIVSAIVGLSAVVTAPLALRAGIWEFGGFEVLVIVAGGFGVLIGLGKFREAPAVAMVMVTAVFVCAAMLGEPAVTQRLLGAGGTDRDLLGPIGTADVALTRLAAAMLLGLIAVVHVVLRRPALALRRLGIAALLVLPLVVALGLLMVPSVRVALQGGGQFLVAALVVGGLFVAGVLISAAGHFVIRAFEAGLADDDKTGRTPE